MSLNGLERKAGKFYASHADKFKIPSNTFILADRTKPTEDHDR
jgi:hypothetical protein